MVGRQVEGIRNLVQEADESIDTESSELGEKGKTVGGDSGDEKGADIENASTPLLSL